ncbi:MAG TPA: UbiD family decarboxylase [Methanoregulaceae archaeon]|nr:UbiD family decarboxylase [Methanoregulaceae archaeon]
MREFIRLMRDNGEVTDVEEQVDIRLQAPEMASRTDKLLVFHNTGGMPAVMNVTASRKALSLALGIAENEIVRQLSSTDCGGKVNGRGKISMSNPDLSVMPVMTHFPKDAGPYITAGIIFSKFGDVENASIHRMLVLDRTHVAARLVEGRHTHSLMKKAQAEGKELPVAMTIGVHPAVTFASCSRVPWGDELSFAATLLGGEIGVRECPNGVLVPDAEIVFEGYISNQRHAEGPFVDITGTYDIVRNEPVIRFTGMRIKQGALYHGILPGGNEHKLLMGAPYEPKIYRAVAGVTDVKNVSLTRGGCGYLHAVIQIKKNTEGDAKNAIMAAFAVHTSLKHVVVVDDDIDISNPEDVEFALATRVRADKDVMVITGVRGSSLDPCRLDNGTNVKVGVDATMEMGREEKFLRARW